MPMLSDPTPNVYSKYGAPMGRANGMIDVDERLYLRRVPINNGGYDSGGAYWGIGAPLYCVSDGDDWRYFRARNRDAAKAIIREENPTAKFFR